MLRFVSLIVAAAFGGLLAFFLDPERGRGRRARAQDRIGAFFRRTTERIEKHGRYAASRVEGLGHRLENTLVRENEPVPNDATLVQRVESQIMRGRQVPKGAINFNAEDGVIVLRGELDRPEQVMELEEAARHVKGVRGVKNLLHLHGTPAPNKPAP
jgi:hyperosmotically inducible periplasmic protein